MAGKSRGGKSLRETLIVKPGSKVDLDRLDPAATPGYDRESAEAVLAKGLERLESLQERLYAESKRRILIVLQGIDAAGKDGTVKHVMTAFNPAGVSVVSFKVPSEVERAHDYLWRVHPHVPGNGEITIFNRSHYEEVLVVRVHDFVKESVWRRRYEQINDFERILTEEGVTILKFFLQISPEEQLQRFQDRIDDSTKRWKFKSADLDERKLWDKYTAAFNEALSRCSTKAAPWYVIPADKKWYRNLAVADIIGDVLDELDPKYPPGEPGIEKLKLV
jgi:PPK2 family polyphosphate:nucleotide phosphotransferase